MAVSTSSVGWREACLTEDDIAGRGCVVGVCEFGVCEWCEWCWVCEWGEDTVEEEWRTSLYLSLRGREVVHVRETGPRAVRLSKINCPRRGYGSPAPIGPNRSFVEYPVGKEVARCWPEARGQWSP